MIYAILDTEKVTASPGIKAICSECNNTVISKCGNIKRWHFAHLKETNCSGSEGETDWHIDWKLRFPKDKCEIIINNNGIKKRADFYDSNIGLAIEFQHSPITKTEIHNRNLNYQNIIWIFDVTQKNFFVNKCKNYESKYYAKWSWGNKGILSLPGYILFHYEKDWMFNPITTYPINNGLFGNVIHIRTFVEFYYRYDRLIKQNKAILNGEKNNIVITTSKPFNNLLINNKYRANESTSDALEIFNYLEYIDESYHFMDGKRRKVIYLDQLIRGIDISVYDGSYKNNRLNDSNNTSCIYN